jgi:hypothetical protein
MSVIRAYGVAMPPRDDDGAWERLRAMALEVEDERVARRAEIEAVIASLKGRPVGIHRGSEVEPLPAEYVAGDKGFWSL